MDQLGEGENIANCRVRQEFKITVGYDPPTHRLREIQNATHTRFRFLEYTQDGGVKYEVFGQNKKAITEAKRMVYSTAYTHRRAITERVPISRDQHDLLVANNSLPVIKRESEIDYITLDLTGNPDGGYNAEFRGTGESVEKGKQLLKEILEALIPATSNIANVAVALEVEANVNVIENNNNVNVNVDANVAVDVEANVNVIVIENNNNANVNVDANVDMDVEVEVEANVNVNVIENNNNVNVNVDANVAIDVEVEANVNVIENNVNANTGLRSGADLWW